MDFQMVFQIYTMLPNLSHCFHQFLKLQKRLVDDCGFEIAEVQQVQQKPTQSGQGQSMRPVRDKAWVQTSAARLQVLIAQVLPPLAAHPRMGVRTALAQGQPAALHPVLYLPLLLTFTQDLCHMADLFIAGRSSLNAQSPF